MLKLAAIIDQIQALSAEELTFAYSHPHENDPEGIKGNISNILNQISQYFQNLLKIQNTRNYGETENSLNIKNAQNELINEIIKLNKSADEKLHIFAKLAFIQSFVTEPKHDAIDAFKDALISISTKQKNKFEKYLTPTQDQYKRSLLSEIQTFSNGKISQLTTECTIYKSKFRPRKNDTKKIAVENLETILGDATKNSLEKLKSFRKEFPKTEFDKHRDSPTIQFLKRIANILSFERFKERLWKVNGKEFQIKVLSIFKPVTKTSVDAQPKKSAASRLQ